MMHRTPTQEAVPSEGKLQLDFDRRVFRSSRPTYCSIAKEPWLPLNFIPSPYTVVIGRGNLSTDAPGNNRLEELASKFLHPYSTATRKVVKSTIISTIVEIVQEACPVGAFVKFSKGRWLEASNATVREKIGCVFRDLLHDKYISSSKSKAARRKIKSTGTTKQEYANETSLLQSSPSSLASVVGSNKRDELSFDESRSLDKTSTSYHPRTTTVGILEPPPLFSSALGRGLLVLPTNKMQLITPTINNPPTASFQGKAISQRSIYDSSCPPPFPTRNETQVRQSWNELVALAQCRPIKNTESWTTEASRVKGLEIMEDRDYLLDVETILNGAEAEPRASDIEQQDTLVGAADLDVKGLEIMEDRDFLLDLETIFD
jgi:hypothetical protein